MAKQITQDDFDDSWAEPSNVTKSTAPLAVRKENKAKSDAAAAAVNAAEKKKTLSNMLKNTPIGQIVANPVVQSIGGKADIAKLSTAGKNGGAVQNTAGHVTGKASDVVDPGTDHSKTIEGPLEKGDRAAGQEMAKSSGPIPEPKTAITVPAAAIKASTTNAAGTIASSAKQVPNNIATDIKSGVNNSINKAKTTIEDALDPVTKAIKDYLYPNGTGATSGPYTPPASVMGGSTGLAHPTLTAVPVVDNQNITAAQVVDNSQYSPQQAALINQLMLQAQGLGGPSPAQLMLQQQNQQNINNAMALAASQSGRGLPVAQRQVMQQAALGGQQAAQQMAILRAQEMLQAQGLANTAVQGARGQDLSTLLNNAQLQQNAATSNAANNLTAQTQTANNILQGNSQNIDIYGRDLGARTTERGQDIQGRSADILAKQAGQSRLDGIINGMLGGTGSVISSIISGANSGAGPNPATQPSAGPRTNPDGSITNPDGTITSAPYKDSSDQGNGRY